MNVMSHFTKSSMGGLKYNDFEKELARGRKASAENVEVCTKYNSRACRNPLTLTSQQKRARERNSINSDTDSSSSNKPSQETDSVDVQ